MSDAHRLRLAFSGLHPERIRDLTDRFGGPEAAIAAITQRRVKASEAICSNLAVPAVRREAELASLGIAVARRGEPAYPAHLDRFEDAPDLLFVRGDLPSDPGVGIVGTRRCTAYGLELADAYGVAVTEAGWPVVSGLARGIDGAAHRGMVATGGRGVAVLGCGIDVTYPREHRRLGDQILELGGAIVSEYPPGSRPDAWRFPPRNRRNTSQAPETRSARRQRRCAHLSAPTDWLQDHSRMPDQPSLSNHPYCRKGVSTSVQRWGAERSGRPSACSIPTGATIQGRKWGAGPHSEGSLYRSGYPFCRICALTEITAFVARSLAGPVVVSSRGSS